MSSLHKISAMDVLENKSCPKETIWNFNELLSQLWDHHCDAGGQARCWAELRFDRRSRGQWAWTSSTVRGSLRPPHQPVISGLCGAEFWKGIRLWTHCTPWYSSLLPLHACHSLLLLMYSFHLEISEILFFSKTRKQHKRSLAEDSCSSYTLEVESESRRVKQVMKGCLATCYPLLDKRREAAWAYMVLMIKDTKKRLPVSTAFWRTRTTW